MEPRPYGLHLFTYGEIAVNLLSLAALLSRVAFTLFMLNGNINLYLRQIVVCWKNNFLLFYHFARLDA